ncbi:hypothetical protein [Propionicimonas sp.]|uniref:hypothetical protein n=1 Tax=Propionicimonas sp. TaxID=1955623 RepID=UPI0018217DD2|nr:hypothetical protein [Propionicimonas sp.]MBU3975794.1 hypothetical protein [Actinomycetota bacterium]MBA3022217.1 hypothetical protein [Propionicimonas sp.]MBU3987344.1 hypothetical protein [Actinomycetota bacterium]MBU4006437.1 hypothetical protein [Actinomycetota bacterium]MBU4065316.1 hypothetical protein [Actinomycetota bacterium]
MKRIKQVLVRSERGASAIVVAFSMMFVFAAGALGMDIAKLAYHRQQVRTAIDAAAQAGAYALPDAATARTDAIAFASANFSELTLTAADVKFYCVVAKLAAGGPDTSQFGIMCDPGTYSAAGVKCNDTVCAVPCDVTDQCNMISVSKDTVVKFDFAPAIGIPTGNTGAQTSASCRGGCGVIANNPMDVVVVADRTPSMSESEVNALQAGIKRMLLTMNIEQQYVALGTINKARTVSSGCLTQTQVSAPTYDRWGTYTGTNPYPGVWVPQRFSNDYNKKDVSGNWVANQSSSLWTSVDCLQDDRSGWNTHLAAALKGAGRYLYGTAISGAPANNLASLPDRTAFGVPKKVIVLETDGQPVEISNASTTALNLTNTLDPAAKSTSTACRNLKTVANSIKAMPNALIITISYGTSSASCGTEGNVGQVLAAVASDKNGSPSTAQNTCADATQIAAENGDGDWYYCANGTEDLKNVFAAAMGQVTGNTKFMKIGGVGD